MIYLDSFRTLENGDDFINKKLLSQKAYLSTLKQRTAQEREDISKLLQQRNQLADRLESLKAGNDSVCLKIIFFVKLDFLHFKCMLIILIKILYNFF